MNQNSVNSIVFSHTLWNVFCNNENQYVDIDTFNDVTPLICPNSLDHTIDPDKTVIKFRNNVSEIKILEETMESNISRTGGYYIAEGFDFEMLPGRSNNVKQFDIPISVIAMTFSPISTDNIGDRFDVVINPDTVIGAIANVVNIGDTEIPLNDTAFQYATIGFYLTIDDGVNNHDLGIVIAKNPITKTVTIKNPPTTFFNPLSPSYIKLTMYRIKNFLITNTDPIVLVSNKIGCSYLPSKTSVVLVYNNNGETNHKMNVMVKYLF